MACGCGGGSNRNNSTNRQHSRAIAGPPRSVSSSEPVNIPSPSNISDADKRRIKTLRNNAIRKALGR